MNLTHLKEFLFDLRFSESYFEITTHNVLSVSGEDSSSFLENQITTEVSSKEERSFHESAIVDIKGRLISSFLLVKESVNSYYIIFDKKYETSLLDRLNLYLVSEDVEFEKISKQIFITFNSSKSVFQGKLFGIPCSLNFSVESNTLASNAEKVSLMRLLSGKTLMGTHIEPGELITNSYLTEYAINFNKGCFPGQETISKIYNNRGAAFQESPKASRINPRRRDLSNRSETAYAFHSAIAHAPAFTSS